jgi:hypothetical protein
MTKLISKLILVLVLVVSYLLTLEYFCRNQTSFARKASSFLSQKDKVTDLIMGTSHMQSGVDGLQLSSTTLNMAFPGQVFEIEEEFLKRFQHEMPTLKRVFLEISDIRFMNRFDAEAWNAKGYYIEYGIPYTLNTQDWTNGWYCTANLGFFSNVMLYYYNPFGYAVEVDEQGLDHGDFHDRFDLWNNNVDKIKDSYHSIYSYKLKPKDMEYNLLCLDRTIALCQEHGWEVVLVTPPFFNTFNGSLDPVFHAAVKQSVDSLVSKYKVVWKDYSRWCEEDKYVTWFKNDNHMNPTGAWYFTAKLKSDCWK